MRNVLVFFEVDLKR